MNIRDKKGSITIFVLVGLLFMTGFLLISFGSNVNKSKIAKEQFNIIGSIYSHNDGDANAYNRAYTALRKNNAQTLTASVENASTIELTKTFVSQMANIKIYGNTDCVGNLINDTANSNYGKYQVQIKISNEDGSVEETKNIYMTSQLEKTDTYIDYINYNNKNVVRLQIEDETESIIETLSLEENINIYEDYTKIEILTEVVPSRMEVEYEGYTFE